MTTEMLPQTDIYEANITEHYFANNAYLGTYVSFCLTPQKQNVEGFIMATNTQLSKKLRTKMNDNIIPNHFKVGKKLKVKIINTDGHFYDLCVV